MSPAEAHQRFLGSPPNPTHTKLYESGKMGYSNSSLDKELFTAVAILTLAKTTTRGGMLHPTRVVLLMPQTHDDWVVAQLDDLNLKMCNRVKKMSGSKTGRVLFAKRMLGCFNVIFTFNRVLSLPKQPLLWTSFGFQKTDPIPEWMQDNLL